MPTTPGTPGADPPGPDIVAAVFRVTGKSNTVITFAFTVGEGASYKYDKGQDEGIRTASHAVSVLSPRL